jgi:hypothetical protein
LDGESRMGLKEFDALSDLQTSNDVCNSGI